MMARTHINSRSFTASARYLPSPPRHSVNQFSPLRRKHSRRYFIKKSKIPTSKTSYTLVLRPKTPIMKLRSGRVTKTTRKETMPDKHKPRQLKHQIEASAESLVFKNVLEKRKRRKTTKKVKPIRSDWSGMTSSSQKGMRNLTGVLCYRHSLFQALVHIPQFVHFIEDHSTEKCVSDDTSACVACSLRDVVQGYWTKPATELTKALSDANKIFKINDWRTHSISGQGDPEEQLTWIFKKLQEEMPEQLFRPFETSYSSKLQSGIPCPSCRNVSRKDDDVEGIMSIELRPRVNPNSLASYVSNYFVDDISGYKCSKCSQVSNITRTRYTSFSPSTLILQLKRFNLDGSKDSYPIQITESLDLNAHRAATNTSNCQYELSAVVQHSGTSNQGHYRCIAKGGDKLWTVFDDSQMVRTTVEEALYSGNGKKYDWSPYLLFYLRKE